MRKNYYKALKHKIKNYDRNTQENIILNFIGLLILQFRVSIGLVI